MYPRLIFALVYSGLGEADPAFDYLDAAYRDRTLRLPGHLWEKPFDRLRSDARFQDLVRRIGFSPNHSADSQARQ